MKINLLQRMENHKSKSDFWVLNFDGIGPKSFFFLTIELLLLFNTALLEVRKTGRLLAR
jgi:hypothetical protein